MSCVIPLSPNRENANPENFTEFRAHETRRQRSVSAMQIGTEERMTTLSWYDLFLAGEVDLRESVLNRVSRRWVGSEETPHCPTALCN